MLALLGCAYDRDAVAAALRGWRAFDFEQAAADAGIVVAAMRTFAEWDAHPQSAGDRRPPPPSRSPASATRRPRRSRPTLTARYPACACWTSRE